MARSILIEKDKILKRWKEYINELFADERGAKPESHKRSGLPILVKIYNKGKFPVEMIKPVFITMPKKQMPLKFNVNNIEQLA